MSSVSPDFKQNGGSYLISDDNYFRFISGHNEIGRPDGQFMVPSNQMDDLLSNLPNNPREWENQLGLTEGSLGNDDIRRVDVYSPHDYDPRLPTEELSGANDQFIPGGKTPGGQDECVISPFPNPESNPSVGRIANINPSPENAEVPKNSSANISSNNIESIGGEVSHSVTSDATSNHSQNTVNANQEGNDQTAGRLPEQNNTPPQGEHFAAGQLPTQSEHPPTAPNGEQQIAGTSPDNKQPIALSDNQQSAGGGNGLQATPNKPDGIDGGIQ